MRILAAQESDVRIMTLSLRSEMLLLRMIRDDPSLGRASQEYRDQLAVVGRLHAGCCRTAPAGPQTCTLAKTGRRR